MTKKEIEKIMTKTTDLHDTILEIELCSTKSYLLALTLTILSELQREYEALEIDKDEIIKKYWESLN